MQRGLFFRTKLALIFNRFSLKCTDLSANAYGLVLKYVAKQKHFGGGFKAYFRQLIIMANYSRGLNFNYNGKALGLRPHPSLSLLKTAL